MGLNVCRGVRRHYRVYVHMRGHRKWHQQGRVFKGSLPAALFLARFMAKDRSGLYNRGMVALCMDYYDPAPILTVTK